MSPAEFNQSVQYIAWLIAMGELILGLYILVLNPRQSVNLHVGVFLLVVAANSYAVGLMMTASSAAQALAPAVILAMTTSASAPWLLASTVALLKPEWMSGQKRYWWIPVYLLAAMPAVMTLTDLFFNTGLWYTPLQADRYLEGSVITPEFTSGGFSWLIRAGFILSFLLMVGILLYVGSFDKKQARRDRRLAWLLIAPQLLVGFFLAFAATRVQPSVTILLTNTIYVGMYAYAAFQQMSSERSRRKGRLQIRLIAVLMLVTIPTMIAMTAFITNQARSFLEKSANQSLQAANVQLTTWVSTWLADQERALKQFAAQPSVTKMDPASQKQALEAMSRTSPEITLVSTVGLDGMELARSDRLPLKDYRNQAWFQEVRAGAASAVETFIDQTNRQHQLILAVPIIDSTGQPKGVTLLTTNLAALNRTIDLSDPGAGSEIFVIDAKNQVVANTGSFPASILLNFSKEPAVIILRQGNLGPFTFTKEDGKRWRAKAEILNNGWATVVQFSEDTLLAPLTTFQRIAWGTLVTVSVLMAVLAFMMIRQTIRPIQTLTGITAAVAAGDLTQVAPVESDDELGALARSFNTMTNQIRDLVTGLERRVSQRTSDLEQRAVQLQVAAQVAEEAAAIHDLHTLLDYTVRLISERFHFYHAGIFLIDQPGEYAVLASASSEGGRRMLHRGHKLKIGEVGIVGFVASSRQPRIALDVGKDAVFFNNPDLPETRSEMAIPMKAHGIVTGILDVQSTEPAAFTNDDVSTLQILADQIALAIENARLLEASQNALNELQAQYQRQIGASWHQYLTDKEIGFAYNRMGIEAISPEALRNDPEASQQSVQPEQGDPEQGGTIGEHALILPIELKGVKIGQIHLQREEGKPGWSATELEMVNNTLTQISLALENARLQETVRRRAERERLANKIAARTQSSLDIETVMKRTVQEIGEALKAARVQIQLIGDEPAKASSGNGKSKASV